jgi:hypothetical protein
MAAILQEQGVTQVMLLQPPEATSGFDDLLETIYKHGVRLTIFNNLDEHFITRWLPLKTIA